MSDQQKAAPAVYSVDVVLLSAQPDGLSALLCTVEGERERRVPWDHARAGEPLHDEARRIVRRVAGVRPGWLQQVGAFADNRRHPSGAPITVAYVAAVPETSAAPVENAEWVSLDRLPQLPPRQRLIIEGALEAVRTHVDIAPVAFRFLPPTFTLSQLQQVYELLLDRKLHKASFRRALHAAELVAPINEWRSEGRGRPAQLFRYAPKRNGGGTPRGVRFDIADN